MDFRLFKGDLKFGVTGLVHADGDVTLTPLKEPFNDLNIPSHPMDPLPVLEFIRIADHVVRTKLNGADNVFAIVNLRFLNDNQVARGQGLAHG